MSGETQVFLIAGGLLLAFSVFFVRPFGDVLIRLAGADHKELAKWSIDRGYFLGLGLALILSSGISTVALVIASSVAFGIPAFSASSLLLGSIYFFLIFSLDRWLVSDQTAGFATNRNNKFGVGAAWFRNFLAELLKILPRAAVVYFASALFADFILLVVFNTEIQEQTKAVQVQAESQFTVQVSDEVTKRTKDAGDRLKAAEIEKGKLQDDFNIGATAIQNAAKQRDEAITAKASVGITCRNVPVWGSGRNAAGRLVSVIIRYDRQCPQEIQEIYKAYDQQVALFPKSQADIEQAKVAVNEKYKVAEAAAYVSGGAEAEVREEWKDRKPELKDGLLIRMRSLDLLTSKPQGACDPSAGSTANFSDACISKYSDRAADLQVNLRLWILLLEMTPVMIKFVTSILPRRGYASIMAARDEEAKTEADITTGKLRNRVRVEIERLFREERIKMEIETSGEEVELRELERARIQETKRRIRQTHRASASETTVILPRIGKKGRRFRKLGAMVRRIRRAVSGARNGMPQGKRLSKYMRWERVPRSRSDNVIENERTQEIPSLGASESPLRSRNGDASTKGQRVVDSEEGF